MIFFYRAKTADGKEVSGTREAEDKYLLARELRSEGLLVMVVDTVHKKNLNNKISSLSIFRSVKMKDLIIFANNLGAMVGSGLALSRALSVMGRQTSNKYFKEIIEQIEVKINQGESLSQAMEHYKKVFGELFIAMIATAEESGRLPEALTLIGEQLAKSYELRRKVIGAMIYPAVIIVAIIIVGILMMVFLVPTLTATFKEMNVDLPLSTKLVIMFSDFLVNNLILVFFGVILASMFLVFAWRSRVGGKLIDALVLRLPIVGDLSRKVNSAMVMRTVSSLVSSGVSMLRTIEITERVVGNHYYKAVLKEAYIKVQKGVTLSSIFREHEKLFPVFVDEMTAVGEETGRLSEMLLKGAIFYENEVDQTTKNLSTIIEPVLMIFIGLAVGLFAVSMIGPMYSLSDAIR